MKLPCIAIDVSKDSSHIQAFTSNNKKFSEVKVIDHDDNGFNNLKALINELSLFTSKEVIVAFEDTGVYDKSLQMFLTTNEVRYAPINPLVSAKSRKTSLRGVKTDAKDCSDIAKVYFNSYVRYKLLESEYRHRLRKLNRYYEESIAHLRKYKVNMHESLDVIWPMYSKVFKNMFTNLPLRIIEEFGHPYNLKRKHHKTIKRFIFNNSNHRDAWCDKKAFELLNYANSCYPGCLEEGVDVEILANKVMDIRVCLKRVDDTLEEIIDLAKLDPNFKVLISIPGIAQNLASRIIAEIGNIERFDGPKQLIAYAGLDPIVYESGKYKGKLAISKKGNKRLRCLLYLAVRCSLRTKSQQNSIKDYFIRKTQQGKLHGVALIACCNKLLRIIYSMCITGTTYKYN